MVRSFIFGDGFCQNGQDNFSCLSEWQLDSASGGIDMAFTDGHVEAVKLEKLWSYYWHVGYVPLPLRPR